MRPKATKTLNLSHSIEDDSLIRELSSEMALVITNKYLPPVDTDFLYLILKGRRTKEISLLLGIVPCEVVRRRRILTRKIKMIYVYHYKLDYLPFLKFAAKTLYPDQFQCLILHYLELMSLQKIATRMGIEPSTAKRWLTTIKAKLTAEIKHKGLDELKVFLDSFSDLTYLNIKEIKRTGQDLKRFNSTQIGKATLAQWATETLMLDSFGNFKFEGNK